DIMPSVLGYLGYDQDYIGFGRDIFREQTEPFAFNYKDNVYQLFMGDYLLMFDGNVSVGLYDFKRDEMITQNLLEEKPDVAARLEQRVKAIIQQYNNRMVDDNLVVSETQSETVSR